MYLTLLQNDTRQPETQPERRSTLQILTRPVRKRLYRVVKGTIGPILQNAKTGSQRTPIIRQQVQRMTKRNGELNFKHLTSPSHLQVRINIFMNLIAGIFLKS
jgi:hypothetical protein